MICISFFVGYIENMYFQARTFAKTYAQVQKVWIYDVLLSKLSFAHLDTNLSISFFITWPNNITDAVFRLPNFIQIVFRELLKGCSRKKKNSF